MFTFADYTPGNELYHLTFSPNTTRKLALGQMHHEEHQIRRELPCWWWQGCNGGGDASLWLSIPPVSTQELSVRRIVLSEGTTGCHTKSSFAYFVVACESCPSISVVAWVTTSDHHSQNFIGGFRVNCNFNITVGICGWGVPLHSRGTCLLFSSQYRWSIPATLTFPLFDGFSLRSRPCQCILMTLFVKNEPLCKCLPLCLCMLIRWLWHWFPSVTCWWEAHLNLTFLSRSHFDRVPLFVKP